jgi:hypothetical protein
MKQKNKFMIRRTIGFRLATRWWIDAMEIGFDWLLGGLALAHYCGIL